MLRRYLTQGGITPISKAEGALTLGVKDQDHPLVMVLHDTMTAQNNQLPPGERKVAEGCQQLTRKILE